MIEVSTIQAAEMCGGTLTEAAKSSQRLKGVSTDTRTILPGCLFIPLIGDRFNGHEFVTDAIMKGAAAYIWQRDQGAPPSGAPAILVEDTLQALQQLAHAYRKSLPVRVIGVTGSNGKTTTKDLLAGMLSGRYQVLKTKGNYNNHIGVPLMMLQLSPQTEVAVLEMGMSARGEIGLLTRMAEPELAVITHIGESHLEHLGSQRGIAEAKLEIVEGLQPNGILIIPSGLPVLEEAIQACETMPLGTRVIRVGREPESEYAPAAVEWLDNPTRMRIVPQIRGHAPESAKTAFSFEVPIVGEHHVRNALIAYVAAKWMGLRDGEIAKGCENVQMTAMRSQMVKTHSGWTVMNDAYNASPSSVRAAIEALRALPNVRRRIVILGDMLELGAEAAEWHAEIGRMLRPDQEAYVFLMGPLSRFTYEAARVSYPVDHIRHYEDKASILAALSDVLIAGDHVLVKGSRGMKMEEIVQAMLEKVG
jgi:UDP-N-acetylmuramoyl-tripeptide--D-alanyl-D-alanine ligase